MPQQKSGRANAEREMHGWPQEIGLIWATLRGKFNAHLELDHHENAIRNCCYGRGGTFDRATGVGTIGRRKAWHGAFRDILYSGRPETVRSRNALSTFVLVPRVPTGI